MPHSIFIDFEVRGAGDTGREGWLRVREGSQTLVEFANYPLDALAAQLAEWSKIVDDGKFCRCFLVELPGLEGTFRIEPRPESWQFTSGHEVRRHAPRPLHELRNAVDAFVGELREQSV